jgi:hypothetical protein
MSAHGEARGWDEYAFKAWATWRSPRAARFFPLAAAEGGLIEAMTMPQPSAATSPARLPRNAATAGTTIAKTGSWHPRTDRGPRKQQQD